MPNGVAWFLCICLDIPHVAVTDIHVSAGNNLNPSANFNGDQTLAASTVLADRKNETCLNVEQGQNLWLQAVIMVTNSSACPRMSVEVVHKDVEDCSSVSWNWFVESRCLPGNFLECHKSQLNQELNHSRCIVSCKCNPTCDYVYLKYTPAMYKEQSEEKICDVYLLEPYQVVIPEAQGLIPRRRARVPT